MAAGEANDRGHLTGAYELGHYYLDSYRLNACSSSNSSSNSNTKKDAHTTSYLKRRNWADNTEYFNDLYYYTDLACMYNMGQKKVPLSFLRQLRQHYCRPTFKSSFTGEFRNELRRKLKLNQTPSLKSIAFQKIDTSTAKLYSNVIHIKGKGKGTNIWYSASSCESSPQNRSGMTRVLKGFHSFTCTPTRSIHNWNELYLLLPSQL